MDKLSRYCDPTLNILLFGDTRSNDRINSAIFEVIQECIIHNKRFEN